MSASGPTVASPAFAKRVEDIASDGSAGWAIADAAATAIEGGKDVISLCLGDTSFDTPSFIVEAMFERVRAGRTHYAPVPGTPELRQGIAAAQSRFDGQAWHPDEVTVFAGAQNALFAAVMCLADPTSEVLFLEPWYATYEATIRVGGATARPVKLSIDGGAARLSESVLTGAVTGKTRAMLLNSPNNPGGYVLGPEDLSIIAKVAAQHDLWIISDEVYRSAVYDAPFTSIASLPGMRARTIIVNSVSKSHAMTGWRLGWTLSPLAATPHLQNLSQCMLFGSPTFIQDAAAVGLTERGDGDMRYFSAELRRRRDIMCAGLAEIPDLRFVRPAGGMFCFVDVSATGMSGSQFAERLFAEEGLAVVPGFAFGPNMAAYIRLSFSGSEEIVAAAIERLRRFCATLRG